MQRYPLTGYQPIRHLLTSILRMHPLAAAFWLCVNGAAGLLVQPAGAASPYVVDGVALGASLHGTREYECSPSEQFAEYTWCQRKRQERTGRRTFSSTTSVLHDGGGVVYVNREIRPAFFARNDIQTEIKRLSAKFGAPAHEMRLPEREGISNAVIAVWGSVQLEPLDGNDFAALQSGAISPQGLLVDHLGDIAESLSLGLPIYRLKGGPGYLWSAASDRAGRGHLRFLALDESALAGPQDVALSKPIKDAVASKPAKEAVVQGTKEAVGLAATSDLRAFLTPQPTSIIANDAATPAASRSKDRSQQSIVQKTRVDAERARLMDAERMAIEERERARVAWARFEAEAAAYEARDRVKWIVAASLLILIAVLALLRIMTREVAHPGSAGVRSTARTKAQTAIFLCIRFGLVFLQRTGVHLAAVMMKARATMTNKSILAATHGHS
jgi:hypothetical protein